jgi:uncharacterized protein (DUF305 family)
MLASQAGENRIFEAGGEAGSPFRCQNAARESARTCPAISHPHKCSRHNRRHPHNSTTSFQLMTVHHASAVRMAVQEWHGHRDPRLRIMAHAIRHEQQGEIALMQEIEGLEALSTATTNMFRDNVN